MNIKVKLLVLFASIISVLTACSMRSGSVEISTTAVTDNDGQTHIYEIVTDESNEPVTEKNGNTIVAEIETDKRGKAVTDKNDYPVTKNSTTVLATTAKSGSDDNDVEFEAETNNTTLKTTTSKTEESTTQKPVDTDQNTTEKTTESEITTQSVTDSEGWINKWY